VILLDTHVLIWLSLEPRRLSTPATAAIRKAQADGGLAVASITLWEIAMMIHRGRLIARGTSEMWITELLARTHVVVREITAVVAALATQLPDDPPTDPADRLIAATARADGVPLVTKDKRLRASRALKTVW
jgi:PIN domain nuclease of toxin-antitoxin system